MMTNIITKECKKLVRSTGVCSILVSLMLFPLIGCGQTNYEANSQKYEYKQKFMPRQTLEIEKSKTAILIIDPQNDFMSELSPIWALVGPSVKGHNLIEHLQQLIKAAEKNEMFVFYSPHMYTQNDLNDWTSLNGIDKVMFENKMFVQGTKGHEYVSGLEPSASTIILSPHKGLSNFWSGDVVIQLRERGVETLIIAGMSANMCVDSHTRDAIENGFDVIVVADAVAGAGDDAMQAAFTNYEFLAHEVLTTAQVLGKIKTAK
jgi:nicotinamidase-related amidase